VEENMTRLLGGSRRPAHPEIDNIVEHAAGLRSLSDTSRILGVQPQEVLRLIERGVFPDAYQDDGQWRIPLQDIHRVRLSRSVGGPGLAALLRRRQSYGEPGGPPAWLTPAERQEIIAQRLRHQDAVRISSPSAEFGVSQMTIRRDLASLEAEGRLVRTYGGALAPGSRAITLSPGPRPRRADAETT
jgi:hypothetical protein